MAHSDCGWTCGCAGKIVKSLENVPYTCVRGWGSRCFGGGQDSRYFLTYVASGYFRFIRGCILTSSVGSWSSGAQTSLASFCRYSYFLREFSFRSVFCFRFYAHTSASRRLWPGYHGGGRSCTWRGHGECRSGFPGRRNEIRLAWQVGATYVTVWKLKTGRKVTRDAIHGSKGQMSMSPVA